jgi:hypothetical protein
MAEKHPKRPRDLNQWAKRMTDIVSGETDEKKPSKESPKEPEIRKKDQVRHPPR